ncbi:hypothetical protein F2Q70_00009086 [Brassica cretica]|uniref:Uncharacterized protein n=1 Tax=Brassica cretica TaxID=69181 RepID=A0A8S9LRH0_BRACR|nr:hypothetical protein F2Q70_00009086 [Brassica cretica]
MPELLKSKNKKRKRGTMTEEKHTAGVASSVWRRCVDTPKSHPTTNSPPPSPENPNIGAPPAILKTCISKEGITGGPKL